jgi:hypothetical protein
MLIQITIGTVKVKKKGASQKSYTRDGKTQSIKVK